MPPRTVSARAVASTTAKAQAQSPATASAADTVHLAETLLEEAPHVGREAEYEAVVSYVARRWSHESNTALFVCGGCGCGKTSTVKRALRAMSGRVLPCDATGRSLLKRSSLEERGWQAVEAASAPSKSARLASESRCTPDLESVGKQRLSSDLCTPRSSAQLSSRAAGLTPSPTLSSALSHATTSSSSTTPDPSAAATAAYTLSTNAQGEDSQTVVEATLFSSAAIAASASSSPASSGRPSVAASEDSTASALAAAGPARPTHKRAREEVQEDVDATRGHGVTTRMRTRSSAKHDDTTAAASTVALTPHHLTYFQTRYPEVFVEAGKSTSLRSLFGHYVNCADVSGPLLVEAICESIQATCTRNDNATHALLQQLARINGKPSVYNNNCAASSPLSAKKSMKSALHVVALDEVEYVRGGGAKTLAQLAELAYQLPGQLALIFISNQRAFVHVPQMMLEALLFEPYSEEQLRRIGADAASAELHRCELISASGAATDTSNRSSSVGKRGRPPSGRGNSATATAAPTAVRAADVDIKPRLYDYIARKALLEYSGDVRQVIGMCHRVVSVAWEEVAEAKANAKLANDAMLAASKKKTSASTRRSASADAAAAVASGKSSSTASPTTALSEISRNLPAKLEAAVETYSAGGSRTHGIGGDMRHGTAHGGSGHRDTAASVPERGAGSTSVSSSTRSSTALPAAAATTTTTMGNAGGATAVSSSSTSSSGVMTLAKSVRLLQSTQVESDIDRYVGTLPEQTLYVLSCIVVLTLRRQEERTHAMTSVGGRLGTSRTPNAGVAAAHRAAPTLSLKLQEVHQLYTRLMTELHFPAMRADGFPLQVECLADFGVLTRPQLRGTDRIFSLNGTWTLPAMQQALVKRGEAIREDRLAAGAETVMENKFEEVLRELARLIKY